MKDDTQIFVNRYAWDTNHTNDIKEMVGWCAGYKIRAQYEGAGYLSIMPSADSTADINEIRCMFKLRFGA